MEILMVAPEYPPKSIGGGGVVIKALAQGLEKQGHQLKVVSALYDVDGFFDRPYETSSGGTTIQWLPLIPAPKVGFQLNSYLPPNLFSIIQLTRIFLKRDFDVVHIHGYGHFFCDFAAILSRLSGKPYVYTIHGFPKEPKRRGGLLGALYGLYSCFLSRPLVQGASKIVAVSGDLGKECTQYFPQSDIEVISNGIDPEYCTEPPTEKSQEVALKYKLRGKKVILGLGRLCASKGFQYAIKALPMVLEKVPQAHLVITGSDDGYGYSNELKRLIEKTGVKPNVSFLGRVEDGEKNLILWQATVVVIPSLEEPFGLVAPEAMGSGRPVVASRVGGLPETLANDKYSCLVESGDEKQLAAALISALTDSNLQRGARENRVIRLGKYDLNHMAHAYTELYSSISTD